MEKLGIDQRSDAGHTCPYCGEDTITTKDGEYCPNCDVIVRGGNNED